MDLLTKLGIPGIVILVITSLFKLKPITLLTSTYVEQTLQTKEKTISVKVIRYIWQLLIVFLVQVVIFIYASYHGINMYKIISYVGFGLVFVGLLISLIIRLKPANFRKKIKKLSDTKRFSFLLILVFLSAPVIFMIPFSLGSAIALTPVDQINISSKETLVAIIIMVLSLSCVSHYLFKWQLNSITLALSGSQSIFFVEGSTKWYIYYPVDDKYFLSGNQPDKEESTVFRYFERSKLLEKELHIFVNKGEAEAGIEYII